MTDVAKTFDAMAEAILDVDVARRADVEAADWQSLAWTLDLLTKTQRALSAVARSVEDDLVAIMPERQATIEGLGTIEKHGGADRKKWESVDLAQRLVRDALDPEHTGEIPSSPAEAVAAAVSTLLACAPFTGSMGWRVRALRDRGIDPDEWCEVTPGRITIQFHQTDEQKGRAA